MTRHPFGGWARPRRRARRPHLRRASAWRSWLGLVTIVLALLPAGVSADCNARVYGTGGEGVWLKEAPGLDAPRIKVLPEGTPLQLLEGPKRGGDEHYWARVEAEGDQGWIIAEYLLMDNSPPPVNTTPSGPSAPALEPEPPLAPAPPATADGLVPGATARVAGTGAIGALRLRAAPAPWETLLTVLPEGTTLQIVTGPTTGGNGNPWYEVSAEGQGGWVDGSYLVPGDAPAPPPPTAPDPPTAPALGGLTTGGWAQVVGAAPAGGLRLRAAPAPWETLLTVLPEGTTLRIVEGPTTGGNSDPWYRVTAGASTGWVDGVYLRASSAPGAAPATTPAGAAGARGAALVKAALGLVGKPYIWGATGPDGFDCSGLIVYVAREALGVDLPRIAADQAFAGVHVDVDKLAPGDLVFYANTYQPGISHVGIYIGGGRWVTAEDENSGVVVRSLDLPYWKARYAGARRIV